MKKITLASFLFIFCIVVAVASTPKNIKTIKVQDGQYNYKFDLTYDAQGRMIKAVPSHFEDFGITYFHFGNNSLRLQKGDLSVTCVLNDKGFIKKIGQGEFPILISGEVNYDAQGKVSSISNKEYNVNFTWKNDDLIKLHLEQETINITYSHIENKNNWNPFIKIEEQNCTYVFPFYNMFGKNPKHLPASISGQNQTVTYHYQIDPEGYITTLTMTYPDNKKQVTYKFTYQ